MRGEPFVYPGVMSTIVRSYLDRLRRGERMPETVLTSREDEVLKLIAEGQSTREIAQALTISPKTVERHRANILAKLGMRDRTQLTRYAIRAGLVEP
jgi:DNA-binding NarL/FixJ family response regulator